MTNAKTIQKADTLIENLEITSDLIFNILCASFRLLIPISIICYVTGLNPYIAQLGIKLYFLIAYYTLISIIISQVILEWCRDSTWAEEELIDLVCRYGLKKGIKRYVSGAVNKIRPLIRNSNYYSTTPTSKNSVFEKKDDYKDLINGNKKITKENINEIKIARLDKNTEEDSHPFVTEVVNECMSKYNEDRSCFIHQNDQYNREGKANISKIIDELVAERSSYKNMSSRRMHTLIKDRLPDQLK